MEISEDLVQLGFAEDDGLGDLLLERLLAGSLRVLWEPLDLLTDEEADELRDGTGDVLTVLDAEGEPVCNVRVVEVFATSWGQPDPRLVAGEGYGEELDAWRRFVGPSLAAGLAEEGIDLSDDTQLLVQQVELLDIADRPDAH